ncbi:hypothetical protein [Bacillus sp. FJAT-49736]|uniref:hypothetical protein n=1 Tax=Bacillus sp. FJAT-49736 TaxID=2833582 RepID=UPI001BCA2891|nr:hypothetical protein [Bacillus sp. FJAT-49736]MBS4174369.1 hypothetical protein [Bacillus sp. FJAT-49736]
MLPFPRKFDENEWFVIIGIIVVYTIFFILPKRFPIGTTILIMMYGSTVARIFDHLLASPRVDLYNFMDTPNFDLFDLFLYFFYAPFSYFFIYFYVKFKVKGFGVLCYIMVCSLGGMMFEWLAIQCHVFTYRGWHLAYSFTIYLFIQTLDLLLYEWCSRHSHSNHDARQHT